MFYELELNCVYSTIKGPDVTDYQLEACAQLFSQNYGVWNADVLPPLKPGARVKMNASRLRAQCLMVPDNSILVICKVNGDLVGHVFSTVWKYNGEHICWITQLVVSCNHREQGIATTLLRRLPGPDFKVGTMGLVSSHPAACLALAKRARVKLPMLDLKFIQDKASPILKTSVVDYLKTAELRGSLFQNSPENGVISSVFTNFQVNHAEPLAALEQYRLPDPSNWPLGELLDGHEYLMMVSIRESSRSSYYDHAQ